MVTADHAELSWGWLFGTQGHPDGPRPAFLPHWLENLPPSVQSMPALLHEAWAVYETAAEAVLGELAHSRGAPAGVLQPVCPP